MKIYENMVTDWVIAESMDDANQVLCEHYQRTPEKLLEDELQVVGQRADDKPLTITDDDGTKTTLLPEEWVAREGRGFLCSTEF